MKIKRGDLKPDLVIDLTDDPDDSGERVPFDPSAAESIRIIGVRGTAVVFDRTPTSQTGSELRMEWTPGDTAVVGRIFLEVEITWPGDKPQTVPVDDAVIVVADYA